MAPPPDKKNVDACEDYREASKTHESPQELKDVYEASPCNDLKHEEHVEGGQHIACRGNLQAWYVF